MPLQRNCQSFPAVSLKRRLADTTQCAGYNTIIFEQRRNSPAHLVLTLKDDGHKGPPSVSTLLARITNEQGWRQQLDTHSLFLHWDKLVDKTTSTHVRPLKIVGNVLWLEVANSAWMQQLQFQKIQLLELVNKSLRLSRLEDIRFTLSDNKPEARSKPTVHFIQPNPAAQDSFQKQIAGIEDEKIREALMSLWYQSHSCQRG